MAAARARLSFVPAVQFRNEKSQAMIEYIKSNDIAKLDVNADRQGNLNLNVLNCPDTANIAVTLYLPRVV